MLVLVHTLVYFMCLLVANVALDVRCPEGNPGCLRIVTVIDEAYATNMTRQIESISCYARRHGYSHERIDANLYPSCAGSGTLDRHAYFFAKHCVIRQYLRRQVLYKHWLLVLDGDVAAANPAIPMTPFIRDSSDIIFYQRSWSGELAAGNYLVRHSVFSLVFLGQWLSYAGKMPKGFSSWDNGALHPLIAKKISEDPRPCVDGYNALEAPKSELDKYFKWVSTCLRECISPGAHATKHPRGEIYIYMKQKGFVIDGAFVDPAWKASQTVGYPPLYHNVKDQSMLHGTGPCWELRAT